ncbi:MAG: helix-turn-helix transcriptional regulator [Polyangiaceae bacterium]
MARRIASRRSLDDAARDDRRAARSRSRRADLAACCDRSMTRSRISYPYAAWCTRHVDHRMQRIAHRVFERGAADPNRRKGFSAAVTRARALLDERFTETIDLDALAAHARLDKFRLCRAFREQVGLPPHAYVTHRRVARAQDLLARGMSQAEVAASVGFYDQSLMHRHFKRIVRLTPGAFARATAVHSRTLCENRNASLGEASVSGGFARRSLPPE